ncbi:MAG TPA: cupin domain-containing protein [Chitinophagaceae bacterium]|nr:cupin domain-containing protein [Chitinophagaceae bacterium]
MDKINLLEKFTQFEDTWSPKIVGELNGQHVKLVKLHGEFIWHRHDHEDELFFVVKGTLKIAFHDGVKTLHENEMLVVPRGIEHKPIADNEVWVMLFEPATTLNTGNIQNERTKEVLDVI